MSIREQQAEESKRLFGRIRKLRIAEMIRTRGFMSSADLAAMFGVSEMTVRRDLGEEDGDLELDVCADHGRRVFARRSARVKDLFESIAGLVHLEFQIDAVERGCEFRLHVPARARLEVSEAVLFRRDLAGPR